MVGAVDPAVAQGGLDPRTLSGDTQYETSVVITGFEAGGDGREAAAGPFGTTIAHGFLTLSLLVDLAPTLDLPGVRMGINYGLDRVRFITPVPAGSRIRARSKLVAADEVAGGVQVKSEVTVELEGAEKPAMVAETLARLYF